MPPWVAPLQIVQAVLAGLLGFGYAWVAIRSRFPLLRLFCAVSALKAACIVAVPRYTASPLYRDAEVLILALAALGVLEAWWLMWPPGRLPFLAYQLAIAGWVAALTWWLPMETDAALTFSRARRQVWLSLLLFIVVASVDAWRRTVPRTYLWDCWWLYVCAHTVSRLLSYPSYETLAHRWAGYFAAALLYDMLAGFALYGLSGSGGGSSAGLGRGFGP